jgi:DNA repair exonuclease SbcCD ATPase subunit
MALSPIGKKEVEPNLKKINQVLQDFFKKKGKLIPIPTLKEQDFGYWHSSHCKDCSQELEKKIKLAVDDIEKARMESKFKEIGKEGKEIFNQISESEFDKDKWEQFLVDYIGKEIDKLNKEIIAEREREREKLKYEIAELEKITNRTPEQEQKLKELKEKLVKLEQGSSSDSGGDPKKPTNYWPWILGGIGIVLVVGIIVYFLLKDKKTSKNAKI